MELGNYRSIRRLEICGGIASGKTTLAQALREAGYQVILEQFRANPFWRRFYANPVKHGFETEVCFLLQHYSDIKHLSDKPRGLICDFGLLQDLAYAEANLSGHDLKLFKALYERIVKEVGYPNLLVHLTCSSSVELKRIRARRRREESAITSDYLSNLNRSIAAHVRGARGRARIMTVNSETNDFARAGIVRKRIVRQILREWTTESPARQRRLH